MADFTGTTTVEASPEAVFDYLSEIRNLPSYFVRMTSAAPGDGEEVRTTARMPDGREAHGDAWFRRDAGSLSIEWGSEGPSSYRGSLEVGAEDGRAVVAVRLHTTRVEPGDPEVQHGIDETLGNLKKLVEQPGGA